MINKDLAVKEQMLRIMTCHERSRTRFRRRAFLLRATFLKLMRISQDLAMTALNKDLYLVQKRSRFT